MPGASEAERFRSTPASIAKADLATGTAHGSSVAVDQFTRTATGFEVMPLATTTSELSPASALVGTSNEVETTLVPVATPIVLWPCVRA